MRGPSFRAGAVAAAALAALALACRVDRALGYQRPSGLAGAAQAVRGGPWPAPSAFSSGSTTVQVDVTGFNFNVVHCGGPSPCQAAQAWALYKDVTFGGAATVVDAEPGAASACHSSTASLLPVLSELSVSVDDSTIQPPAPGVDESYTLEVTAAGDGSANGAEANLSAATYVGLLRGLETFSQLVVGVAGAGGGSCEGGDTAFYIPHADIKVSDKPSFQHRGVLIDTSRHFISVAALKRMIDASMYSKMNVIHWHITDSHSFPLEVPSRPNITFAGAFSASEVYTVTAITELVSYAAQRGVRLLPEIDTPGHARAFGLSPELESAIACGNVPVSKWTTYCAEPPCGQLNPASPLMYELLTDALQTLGTAFADPYIHLGFDEINQACWEDDASIQKYQQDHNLTFAELLTEFFNKERAIIAALPQKRQTVYWEEAVGHGLPVGSGDVIQIWNNVTLLQQALKIPGVNVIMSWAQDYYADCGTGNIFGMNSWCDPFKTWWTMYQSDPVDGLDKGLYDRVLGGEVALWSGVNDDSTVDSKMWSRASSFGGRLWNYTPCVACRGCWTAG